MKIASEAFDLFNQQMDTDYSLGNVHLQLIDAGNADEIIPEFIKDYSEAVEPDMFEPGYYETFRAEAFVTPERYGIIVRTDTGEDANEWRHLIFHELSHIYCMTHELKDGENFQKKYIDVLPKEFTFEAGALAGGYSVWKEFVAEFMARLLDVFQVDFTIRHNARNTERVLDEIDRAVVDIRECIIGVLLDTMTTRDILNEPDKKAAFKKLERFERLQSPSWQGLLSTVFDQIFDPDRDFWEIDSEFIHELGDRYLGIKTAALMEYAKKHGGMDSLKALLPTGEDL